MYRVKLEEADGFSKYDYYPCLILLELYWHPVRVLRINAR